MKMNRKLAYPVALLVIFSWAWLSPLQAAAQLLPLPSPSLPTGSLVVSITEPASGSTVSSTRTVSASVTIVGTLTVSRVEFFRDGTTSLGVDTTNPYSVSWNTTTTSNGSHTLKAVARDILGVSWNSSTITVTVSNDTTPPPPPSTPNLAAAPDSGVSNTDNLTNDNTPTFTGTAEAGSTVKIFSDGVQVGSGTATGGAYSITTSALSSGTHSITATATDAAKNVSPPSGALSVTIDTTRPTVTISQAAGQPDPTNTSPINFTAVFSESVSGFTSADVMISGTAGGTKTVAVTGGPSTYTVAVSGMTAGTVIATIPAGAAQDTAGNGNTASTSTDNSVAFGTDTTPPTVTINQAAGQADPTNASPINFTVVFSEPVSGFTGTDVTISGTAGGTTTVNVTGGPSTYNAAVSGTTNHATATVIATIAAGVAQDAAGNANTASTSTDNTVTFDTTAPTVAITSPSDQEKVSGTIPVSANASDNVGVVSVVFKLDGADPGLEDTTEPYSVLFDTTTTSDGPHTLTAVARDAAGNQTTSASVSVTVSNAPPPQPAPTITSFMPTSGSVGSSVTIKGTNFTGATAVKFNGVSASFMVTSATEIQATVPSGATTGLLSVTTPGGTATSASAFTVEEGPPSDTTPPTVSINQAAGQPDPTNTSPINFTVVFSEPVSDFTAADVTITGTAGGTKTVEVTGGPSTYTVAVSGMTNGTVIATIAAGVAKDAAGNGNTASTSTDNTVTFTTTTDTVTRFEEDNAAISYSPAGAWVQRGPEIAAFSGGIAVSSDVAGATATFTFTGTAVSWIGLKCSVCGIASVSIDGGAATSIDTAGAAAPGSPGLTSEVVFTTSGLADESHTMVITVTGTTTSADAHIIVDAFDVTGTGGGAPPTVTRIEETDPAVSYTGNWFQVCDPRASGGCGEESIEVGAQATLSFTGTGVRWIGWRNEGGGIANVYVDGILKGEVDTYSPTTEPQAEALTASGLPGGPHTLTIEVTGRGRNPATGTWIIIDAFDVTP